MQNHCFCVKTRYCRYVAAYFQSRTIVCSNWKSAKNPRPQDPEEVKNMPIFQYATKKSRRSLRVYVWGRAACGALGIANFLRPQDGKRVLKTMHKPFRLSFAETHMVQDVSCGYGFTVLAAVNDKSSHSVFGTGLNTDSQIGYHAARKGHPLIILAQPVPVLLPLVYPNTKAMKVSAGRAHTAILTDEEGVFTLGNNAYGQCGRPIVEGEIYEGSTRVNRVKGIEGQVTEIVCGQDHLLFLTAAGEVYSCGWGADGQTGLGHYENQGEPKKVKGDIDGEKIIQVSGAGDCVLAVSEKGEVFGWGNSEYGQLKAATSEMQINVPRKLNLPSVGRVMQVASGGTMCAILNDKGQVFVWGYGILGKGPKVDSLEAPSMLPETLFGQNELNPNVCITQVVCGLSHFAAVTNSGDLYMWGKNREACLGLGHKDDQFFPFRVSVPAEVLKVSCGVDHTAALCRAYT